MESYKMKIKEFLIGLLYGGICFYLGVAIAGLISLFTGFYNKYFILGFGTLFTIIFIYKFEELALKFFKIK